MEGVGLRVPLRQTRLKLLVRLRHLALGGRLAGLRLGDQFRAPGLILVLGLALLLAQLRLGQDVVDDAADAPTERLLDVPAVELNLEIAPEALQIAGVDERGRLVFEQEILPVLLDDPIDLARQRETA